MVGDTSSGTRSEGDLSLRKQAEAELAWDVRLATRSIRVTVNDGTVELTGRVRTYLAKWQAERAVERVRGVRAVANEIRVVPLVVLNDGELTAAASVCLAATRELTRHTITVAAYEGWLALEGQVEWDFQRRAVADAVRSVPGLRGVTNAITIRPRRVRGRAGSAVLGDRLAQALRRDALIDASRITVAIDGGHVTLAGSVAAVVEAREAEQRAWGAPGVWSVDNLLRVEPIKREGPRLAVVSVPHATSAVAAAAASNGSRQGS